MKDRFTQEEANEILLRAVEQQPVGPDVTRQQLESLAAEIGVTPEALDRAHREWEVTRADHALRAALEAEKRAEFRSHLISYVGVNLFLLLLNGFVSPGFWWAMFPILGWGLGLFFHGMAAHGLIGNEDDREFRRWRDRHEEVRPAGERRETLKGPAVR